jgi:hypothetical protein
MSNKGLSKEQKTKIISNILKSKEPFTLPELEKLASAAGVVQQSVKDIITELCDDKAEVDSDRIGPTLFYWSFPTSATVKRRREQMELNESINNYESTFKKLKTANEELLSQRHQSDKRTAMITNLKTLKQQNLEISQEVQKMGGADPELIEALQEDTQMAIQSANRWTDNIWTLKKWACDKFSVDSGDFDKNFDIMDGFDYVQEP